LPLGGRERLKLLQNIPWQIRGAWKRFTSVFKREWTLGDYPVRVQHQEPDGREAGSRLKRIPWYASVWNWSAMSGSGDTKEEALSRLRERFAEFVATGEPLPRPGVAVPLKFAARGRTIYHEQLAKDFTERVLNLDWAWISDQSSLWDFHGEPTNDRLIAKVREVYGVDVSDLADARLVDIFDRIQSSSRN
jgi:hypothetical protein